MLKTLSLAGAIVLAATGTGLANPVSRTHTTVELTAETASVAPGKPLALALTMTPQPKWHTYWKNPGDSGMETTVTWQLPEGFKAGELEYPTPIRLPFGGELLNFAYEGASTLLVTLTPPADLKPGGSVPISAKVAWLVCDDQQCVPEDAELKLTLPAGDGAAAPAKRDLFAKARAAMPTHVDWPVKFATSDDRFTLHTPWALPDTDIEEVLFFPLEDGVISYTATQDAQVADGRLRLSIPVGYKPDMETVTGILTVRLAGAPKPDAFFITATRDDSLSAALPPGKVITSGGMDGHSSPGGGSNAAVGASGGATGPDGAGTDGAGVSLPLALVSALLGGLLLNLMPCVFPILSLKALSLARAGGGSEREARTEGLAYTAGVLVTMGLLGGLLLALKAGGEAVGWAFHLQDPRMVALLALLMTAIGLNLAGVFEITTRLAGSGQSLVSRGGAQGSFWTGALAVLVATPCTAPFMAAALGATLTLPPALSFLVYLALGLGMALPFLLLGFIRPLRALLPRPGAWMDTFRRVLAFPMFATALWLFWIVGRQLGLDAMVAGLAVALLMALGLWLMGRGQGTGKPMRLGWGLAALLVALAGGLSVPRLGVTQAVASNGAPVQTAGGLSVEPFSEAKLNDLVQQGKPTFVYFTADWCVTCKVNERVALERAEVADAFNAAGVSVLVGDWTRRDDAITAVLRRHGRDGVPLYLYFPKGSTADAPVVLPQILTPSLLIETVA
ncbi:MAG TPA: protein-disulfide reductase DsbD domain-containing protein [Pedomonas sp.]|uniref:protein-disulfide reductase DsbD family protein n=1 Tax=Pedomonas sp. TaxID=2976421 RepID=UPI002F401ADF